MDFMSDVLEHFHPAVARWFRRTYAAPTEPQTGAWPLIQSGRHVLIAAPTGSGKTLAAFLAAIDALVRLGVRGQLGDETRVVYVSPLKALSNDIDRNLEAPLAGIREDLVALGYPDVDIRTLVRTGDTPMAERSRMRRRPPHILVTTPESLYILLTSESGRAILSTTRAVIVDEIHALAPNKRGAHLALSLERLEELAGARLTRIGLSATQRPIEHVARFLVGSAQRPARGLLDELGPPVDLFDADTARGPGVQPPGTAGHPPATADGCAILDAGHARRRDLALELPESPLEAVMSAEVWEQVYARLGELIETHRSTLVFVNTRRLAERLARALSERLGEKAVTSHHGSLAREQRLDAELRLKRGELRALVATSSLELGIDVGHVDLVCQIATPRAIAVLLQRVGRSGHAIGALPKGRLFPLTRDDLAECVALLDAVRRGELDCMRMPHEPLDVLAQQIAAEVACREWGEDELFALFTRAWPYHDLTRARFEAIVRMLSEGFSTRRGRNQALIHRDSVQGTLRARKGLRLTAVTCGGTIPDTADYNVVLEPAGQIVGTVNEDFAIESMAGDVFQLGNTSYRIQRVEGGRVRVEDAQGQPPSIPFWIGEAPARTDEVSASVSRLREEIEARLLPASEAVDWLTGELGLSVTAASQLVDYYAAGRASLTRLPTQKHLVFERFFDESGGTQLIIHSPYGSRLNRAWGLSLRKRFCRKFNFELQAAATEDAIILSLTATHSFPLEEPARYLHSSSVCDILVQALLDAPMFITRWRWNASVALALPRFHGGSKVPAQLQRMHAEDLVAAVFPDQIACLENIAGDREIPDHPLVEQTIHDCLHEAMDIDGLQRLLRALESGQVQVTARDLTEPSMLALEILAARPYAFLDDAPLEERRTQAVMARRWLDPESAADLGRLDPEAIARVREEAWPQPGNADEMHDALALLGFVTGDEVRDGADWSRLLGELERQGRAARITLGDRMLWIARDRVREFAILFPGRTVVPALQVPDDGRQWTPETALVEIVRGRLEALGPARAPALADSLQLPQSDVDAALLALEAEGFAMRGVFTGSQDAGATEWCERRLLARINRYTVKRLRQEIEPVSAVQFMHFLFTWQHAAPGERMDGPDAVAALISQLEGYEAAAGAWESEILPARLAQYDPAWLDELCLAGRVLWTRLEAPRISPERERTAGPVRATPVTLITRRNLALWSALGGTAEDEAARPSARARQVADYLREQGASFFDDICHGLDLPRSFAEEALAELVANGLVASDAFSGLRALLLPADRRQRFGSARHRASLPGIQDAGRWALIRRKPAAPLTREALEQIARALLKRYGVVFWRVLAREADWLPSWRELLLALRRMETRGEIRGGRFVAGFSGEQFALPEAIVALRENRRRGQEHGGCVVCGADPLNLAGILTPGPRVPATPSNRLLVRDGIPVAALVGGQVQYFETLTPEQTWEVRKRLERGAGGFEQAVHAAS
ncbi:MAG: DEAD/DEAH box helicase [Burkholderiales bacterium]|nr:DEAD/DEAH box helicase [Burkholderiales bacterium]